MQSVLHNETFLSRAETIVCSFSCDSPVPNAVSYFSRMGIQTSVWMCILEGNEFQCLTTLVLPITHSLYEAGYPSEHAFATFKAPALQKLRLIAVRSKRYWHGFPDGYRPSLEGYYAEAHVGTDTDGLLLEISHLQNFIAGAPALNELVIQGVIFYRDTTELVEATPLLLSQLTKACIISTDSVGSFELTALVSSPLNSWDIQTHVQTLQWPLPVPPLIAHRLHNYNDMTIDHSRAVTFLSFSADNFNDCTLTRTRKSPLSDVFAAQLGRLNLHIQPRSVTMAGRNLESIFEHSPCIFASIVIGRLDELLDAASPARGQRDPATWTFLQRVQEVGTIVLYGRQDVESILISLPCPCTLQLHCATALKEEYIPNRDSIVPGLSRSLKAWRQRGMSLQYLIITGMTESASVQGLYDIFPQCVVRITTVED